MTVQNSVLVGCSTVSKVVHAGAKKGNMPPITLGDGSVQIRPVSVTGQAPHPVIRTATAIKVGGRTIQTQVRPSLSILHKNGNVPTGKAAIRLAMLAQPRQQTSAKNPLVALSKNMKSNALSVSLQRVDAQGRKVVQALPETAVRAVASRPYLVKPGAQIVQTNALRPQAGIIRPQGGQMLRGNQTLVLRQNAPKNLRPVSSQVEPRGAAPSNARGPHPRIIVRQAPSATSIAAKPLQTSPAALANTLSDAPASTSQGNQPNMQLDDNNSSRFPVPTTPESLNVLAASSSTSTTSPPSTAAMNAQANYSRMPPQLSDAHNLPQGTVPYCSANNHLSPPVLYSQAHSINSLPLQSHQDSSGSLLCPVASPQTISSLERTPVTHPHLPSDASPPPSYHPLPTLHRPLDSSQSSFPPGQMIMSPLPSVAPQNLNNPAPVSPAIPFGNSHLPPMSSLTGSYQTYSSYPQPYDPSFTFTTTASVSSSHSSVPMTSQVSHNILPNESLQLPVAGYSSSGTLQAGTAGHLQYLHTGVDKNTAANMPAELCSQQITTGMVAILF